MRCVIMQASDERDLDTECHHPSSSAALELHKQSLQLALKLEQLWFCSATGASALVPTMFLIMARLLGMLHNLSHVQHQTHTHTQTHTTSISVIRRFAQPQTIAITTPQTNASFVVTACRWGMTPTLHPTRHLFYHHGSVMLMSLGLTLLFSYTCRC